MPKIAEIRCAQCHKRVPRKGARQVYCGKRCRQRASYHDKVRTGGFAIAKSGGLALPTTPHKKINDINALLGGESWSSIGLALRRNIIETERFAGHEWRDYVSADGARCQIAKLRSNGLIRHPRT